MPILSEPSLIYGFELNYAKLSDHDPKSCKIQTEYHLGFYRLDLY